MILIRSTVLALGSLAASVAFAQGAGNFPTKPVRVIVPLGAGGLTDIMARLHAAWFNKKYGQPMIVENRPGANGMIAAEAVAKSDPDGYTLLSWSNGTAYASLGNKEARIDTHKTLRGVGAWSVSGLFILVGNSVPANNMKEFVSYVKANPGKLNYAAPGRPNAEMLELRQRLGLDFVTIVYKGGAAAIQAVLAGESHIYNSSGQDGIPNYRAGKVKLLAYGGTQRHPLAPEVPTVKESGVGLDDYVFQVWLGLFAPSGTPAAVMRQLNADVNEHARSPEAKALYDKIGWFPLPMTLEETQADLDTFFNRINKLYSAGIQIR